MNGGTASVVFGAIQTIAAIVTTIFAVLGYYGTPGHPWPTWALATMILSAVAVGVPAIASLRRNLVPITFVKSYVEPPTNPPPNFDPKVRLEFRNRSGSCVDVETSRWLEGKHGLTLRHNSPRASWQVYEDGKWEPSPNGLYRIHVHPGEEFRTWVVFDPGLSRADLEKRRAKSMLGKLEVLVGIRTLRFKT